MTIHQTHFERQVHHYAAVKVRLFGEPKRVMRKVEFQPKVSPLKATTRDQQNEYIKLRCRMLKTSYTDITAERLSDRNRAIRDQIVMEIKERRPNIRVKRLAELFYRKENAIRDVLVKFRATSEARPITAEAAQEMRRLRSEGWLISKIGERFGVAENTVRYHLGKKGK